MKILITRSYDSNDLEMQSMSINGGHVLTVGALCECPEDATIERDLVSPVDIAKYMKMAHEAGGNGEPLEIDISNL